MYLKHYWVFHKTSEVISVTVRTPNTRKCSEVDISLSLWSCILSSASADSHVTVSGCSLRVHSGLDDYTLFTKRPQLILNTDVNKFCLLQYCTIYFQLLALYYYSYVSSILPFGGWGLQDIFLQYFFYFYYYYNIFIGDLILVIGILVADKLTPFCSPVRIICVWIRQNLVTVVHVNL